MHTPMVSLLLAASVCVAQLPLISGRPAQFQIYTKDRPVYIIPCTQIDSLTFVDGRMVVHREDANDSLCVADVDSATFYYLGGDAIVVHTPVGGEEYHVGDSVEVTWTKNPNIIPHVYFTLSTSPADEGPPLSNEICVPQDSVQLQCQAYPDNFFIYGGTDHGRYMVEITNPMGYGGFNPLGDSCRFFVGDYPSGGEIFGSSGYFKILP